MQPPTPALQSLCQRHSATGARWHDGLMDLGLDGRAYLVTGASRGLGLATAEHLVADGADVLVASRDATDIAAAASALDRQGPGSAHGVAADLADPDAAAYLVDEALDRFGRLDGAVISVGGPPAASMRDTTDEQWRAAFESIHLGPLRLAREVLETADQPAAVTLVLSTSVRAPVEGLAISNGLRPGLAMAAKTLADEYGPLGHRVNVVLPGRIDTARVQQLDAATGDAEAAQRRYAGLIPLGRYGRPEELGAVVAFVTSPMASYLTGSAVTVDGGLTRTL